ncbi:hypothetical protein TNCV_3768871 [Trichonephila clavipes]|nr:hypothetical protein TNCV_3768871 [Trichonephila clavipes]
MLYTTQTLPHYVYLHMTKKCRQEVTGHKRSIHTSGSGGTLRKRSKGPVKQGNKRTLPSSAESSTRSRKGIRKAEALIQERDIGRYNLRPRIQKAAESRSSRGEMRDQGGPVWSRGRRFQDPRPYIKKNPSYRQQTRRQSRQEQEQELRSGRSSRQCPRRGRGSRQRDRQEMRGKSTRRRTLSLEVLIGDVNANRKYYPVDLYTMKGNRLPNFKTVRLIV